MARTRGFTLVELLTVMAIIAILSGILMPAAMSARALAFQYSATQALSQVGTAATMYAQDNDDTFMPAFYPSGGGIQAWFGFRDANGQVHKEMALLRQYEGRRTLADPTFQAKDYMGDHSGFGYNWAYIGSDFGVTGDYSTFPTCHDAAHPSQLTNPSKTIILATSSYYFAPWLPKGDSTTYDFGFIDPPAFWAGNPDIDFRHNGMRDPDIAAKVVVSRGNAPVVFSDGHVAVKKQTQVLNENFVR